MKKNEEDLILNNIDYAEKIAWKYKKKVGNKLEYDDIKSLCYLGLSKAALTYKNNMKTLFKTYAYTVMKNEIMMCLRKNKEIDTISIYEKINEDFELKDILKDDYNLEENIEQNFWKSTINEKIEELCPQYKKIMKYKLNGKTIKEIGEKVNMKKTQTNYHYQRALNILRKKMNINEEER